MKCEHNWELIDKTILESPHTKALKTERTIQLKTAPDWYWLDKIVFIFKCKECNEIKIEERQ